MGGGCERNRRRRLKYGGAKFDNLGQVITHLEGVDGFGKLLFSLQGMGGLGKIKSVYTLIDTGTLSTGLIGGSLQVAERNGREIQLPIVPESIND